MSTPLGRIKVCGYNGDTLTNALTNDFVVAAYGVQKLRFGNADSGGSFMNISSCNIEISSDVVPLAQNTYSLGTSNLRFQNQWIQGSLFLNQTRIISEDSTGCLKVSSSTSTTDYRGILASHIQLGSLPSTSALVLRNDSNTGLPVYARVAVNSYGIANVTSSTPFSNLSPWTTNGSTLFVGAGSNVGIGQITPSFPLHVSGSIASSGQFISTIATGTAPLTVSSCNMVTNLNANYLGGQASDYYLSPLNLSSTIPISKGGTNTTALTESKLLVASNNTITSPTNLHWTGSALGIGTVAPQTGYTFHVVGKIYASDDITAFSDARYKENIAPITAALSKLTEISGYTYNWKKESGNTDLEKRHAGLLAQEVEKVLPEVVHEGDDGIKGVAYDNVIALLVQAIKELNEKVDNIK